jgi:hypothetical protein
VKLRRRSKMANYLYLVLSKPVENKHGSILHLSPSKNEVIRLAKDHVGCKVVEIDKNDFDFLRVNLPFYDNLMATKEEPIVETPKAKEMKE